MGFRQENIKSMTIDEFFSLYLGNTPQEYEFVPVSANAFTGDGTFKPLEQLAKQIPRTTEYALNFNVEMSKDRAIAYAIALIPKRYQKGES